MVLFILYIKADLEGVGSLALKPDSNICISVRNPLSDYEVRDKVAFNLKETLEQEENSREPPCHFALKWEGNPKRSTLEVLDEAATKAALKKKKKQKGGGEVPRSTYTAEDSGNWVPILAMECRGLEPYAYHGLGDEFVVESEGGVRFDSDVDLSEGDWAEYDAENDAAVSISEFESKFETL
mmetsp:Transcript_22412/g.51678  ORF Transcript_22412/g.51678 Transcript_22412/m.51678 type:complete len:182 (+) Transcript_22412:54-599(+)|eukprot:CAMPEP_0116864548 /NCGR_PEP_ID=MMETSP0418-20121206/24885_1 /TAXON_ID=1158023 /ORGANISM="Astrosyne radiata, Strain 13vi08-1A" /LENGTH=181 /DNA_ID=CAMNT_0004499785 /DNA_START=28 /DNA_END=573 /DNA_ORIENTATION=-